MRSEPVGILLEKRVLVREGYEPLIERGFGEKRDEGLVLSLYEAAYLLEREKIRIVKSGNPLDLTTFLAYAEEKIPEFLVRYAVFKDLRNRGYVVKTGFKFGTHFRVYPRGKKPGEAHTKYVVQVIPEEQKIEAQDLSRMVRLARAIKTELVLALVDAENDVVYYKVERLNL